MSRKILDFILTPFVSIAVLLDESKRLEESWQPYNERKNRKRK